MSQEVVQAVLIRALSDSEFRTKLFESPDSALQGYDLALEEIAAIRAIKPEGPETASVLLGQRRTKSILPWP